MIIMGVTSILQVGSVKLQVSNSVVYEKFIGGASLKIVDGNTTLVSGSSNVDASGSVNVYNGW